MPEQAVTNLIASDSLTIVVGLGITGLSVARYLNSRGTPFMVVDTRQAPPGLIELRECLPDVVVELGEFDLDTLLGASTLVVSPGVYLERYPVLREVASRGTILTSDIELFVAEALAPVVAITGSNGKSTVTSLLGEMALAAGLNVGIGGNLGTPALDLLSPDRELYVLELSSFQLELINGLNASVATVLNVSADHMDRYATLMDYYRAKHRIFKGARQIVTNRDDQLTQPLVSSSVKCLSFGLDRPDFGEFGVLDDGGQKYLAYAFEKLLPVSDLVIKGEHNVANALAALALGQSLGLPQNSMLQVLRTFAGLPHRCQTVMIRQNVTWINDSKATNCGAAIAGLRGLAKAAEMSLIWIAGGQGKGQDFSVLTSAVSGRVRVVILLGEDAQKIATHMPPQTEVYFAKDMAAAVKLAAGKAVEGDTVLLAPACASFDMYSGYEERGEVYTRAVEALR
jgi:UDP-N-acetylmuramoylalanine--D-glutamate ligase